VIRSRLVRVRVPEPYSDEVLVRHAVPPHQRFDIRRTGLRRSAQSIQARRVPVALDAESRGKWYAESHGRGRKGVEE
jgi:hypothetical protein